MSKKLVVSLANNVDHENVEQIHEFLHGYRYIFTTNLYATKDYIYLR